MRSETREKRNKKGGRGRLEIDIRELGWQKKIGQIEINKKVKSKSEKEDEREQKDVCRQRFTV